MRRTSWIWAVGSATWTFDAIVNFYYRNRPHAELSFMVAVMFGIAWAFYSRQQTRYPAARKAKAQRLPVLYTTLFLLLPSPSPAAWSRQSPQATSPREFRGPHRGHLALGRPLAARNNRARMPHPSSRRSRLARNKSHHGLLHKLLDKLGSRLFRRPANLANHNDRFRIRIIIQQPQCIDMRRPNNRIAPNPNRRRLPNPRCVNWYTASYVSVPDFDTIPTLLPYESAPA